VLDKPILQNSRILFVFFGERHLVFFLQRINNIFVHILILYLNDILLVLIHNAKQLPLNSGIVLPHFIFVEKVHLFFCYEIWVGLKVPERSYISSRFFFFIVEFQWFLIELSVLPGSILVISAHLFPWAVCAKNKIHYSQGIHSTFKMLGFRWLCHRSRHCLPNLPSTNLAMKDHL